jgi:hypothetical protein
MNPIVPLALGTATVAALVLALRGKTPAPGPGPIYLSGAAGKRQFEIRHVGEGYSWSVKGDRAEEGADTDSGTAIVTMFESAFSGNSADLVTGSVAKGSDSGLAGSFTIHREDAQRWGWILSKPAPDQASSLGSGDSTNRGGATLEALAAIAPYTDWIVNLPSPQGGIGPMQGGPSVAQPNFQSRNGIIISPTSVSAIDLPTWIAYAGQLVVQSFADHLEPAQIHDMLLPEIQAPQTVRYTGKMYAKVLAEMSASLDAWHANKYLSFAPLAYQLAAQAIGANISVPGKLGRVKGRPIVVRLAGEHYEWLVWSSGNRAADTSAYATGEAKRMAVAWAQAVKAAAAGPGQPQGQPPQDDQGQQPEPPPPKCTFLKTTSFSRNLPTAAVQQHGEKEIKIWEAPSGVCTRFTLRLGVCLMPAGGGTFGALDFYTKDQQGDGPLVAAENDNVTIMLERADGSAVDWWLFRSPVTWKRQYQIDLAYDGSDIDILSTQRIDAPDVDSCPDRARRWPGLGDDHYKIGVWHGQFLHDLVSKNWTSQPDAHIRTEGRKLYYSISYLGLPYFKAGTEPSTFHTLGVRDDKKTSYTIGFKIRAEGTEP